ncbi:MAG: hypothetical protein RI973_1831 [Bacteroidota bacterium]|jgi:uncharacterized protein (TIRG00374 family)
MKKQISNLFRFLVFLGIGAGILALVYWHQNKAYRDECCLKRNPSWASIESVEEKEALLAACRTTIDKSAECIPLTDKLVSDFKGTNFGWLGLVLLAFLLSNISRTYKWQMLLGSMGYQPKFANGFLSILVGYFANLGLPRMGEVVRAGLLSRYESIPVEKVMGTIVADRLVDLFCLGLAALVAFSLESGKILGYLNSLSPTEDVGGGLGLSWILLIALLTAAGLAYLFRSRILGSSLAQRILQLFQGFWEGLQTVRRLRNPAFFIFHSLNIWFLYFLMTWLGFQAFSPTAHLDLRAALTVFVFGTLGFVIPSPGGMGTFHALVIASLTAFYGIRGDDAFSMANIIFFSVQIGLNAMLGLLALLALPYVNRSVVAATSLNKEGQP